MATNDSFSQSNQVVIEEISIYEPDENGNAPAKSDWVNVASMIQEVDLFEDIHSPSMSGQVLLADAFNLPDQFPIEPGNRIFIKFKTPTYTKAIEQLLVVYKIGERIFSQGEEKAQMYWLYLCSEEKYIDVQLDLSYAIKGTYTDIVKKSLKDLNSKKKLNSGESLGIVEFVAPGWSPLTTCDFACARAVDADNSPFFFWEGVDFFNFKSLKEIYAQEPLKRLFIEPRGTDLNTNNSEKLIQTIRKWEYKESLNLLKVHNDMAFGATVTTLNTKDWTVDTTVFDQPDLNDINLEKEPFVVIWSDPKKVDFHLSRPDRSDNAIMKKRSIMSRFKQFEIRAEAPGDSDLRAGEVINLDIPSFSSGAQYVNERFSSGKWLISAIRHIIIRDRYRVNLELVKNSTAEMIL